MSMAAGRAASTRPAPRPGPAPRRLRAVAPLRRRRRLPFVLLTAGLMVAGVLGLVTLNVTVNQQAFTIARLSGENREAERRYTVLQADVDRLKAPGRITRVATARGMVTAGRPRVAAWPGGRPATGSRGSATSPAAPGTRPGDDAAWAQDPFPLKPYLAQP